MVPIFNPLISKTVWKKSFSKRSSSRRIGRQAVGDNDMLSAHVALLYGADKLILLSDIDGLYEQDPHETQNAQLIQQVSCIDEHIKKLAGGSGTPRGTDGMITKPCG